MSNYSQERGVITLPKSKVSAVKKAVVDAHNSDLELAYNSALKLWQNKARLKKNGEWDYEAIHSLLGDKTTYGAPAYNMAIDNFLSSGGLKPKKKDFARVSSRGDVELSLGFEYELSISGNTLRWDTGHDNHQVDRAHYSAVYKAMVKALNSLSFNKNSGGYFEEWSEYGESWRVVRSW